MKLQITAVAALLAVLASAVGGAPTGSSNPALDSFNTREDGLCGHSTFVNEGSDASPWASDCQTMLDKIGTGSGNYVLSSFEAHKEIASYKTCAFGLGWGQLHQGTVVVGRKDVQDLIRDAIRMHRRPDGKVGSKGVMSCGGVSIAWGLY